MTPIEQFDLRIKLAASPEVTWEWERSCFESRANNKRGRILHRMRGDDKWAKKFETPSEIVAYNAWFTWKGQQQYARKIAERAKYVALLRHKRLTK